MGRAVPELLEGACLDACRKLSLAKRGGRPNVRRDDPPDPGGGKTGNGKGKPTNAENAKEKVDQPAAPRPRCSELCGGVGRSQAVAAPVSKGTGSFFAGVSEGCPRLESPGTATSSSAGRPAENDRAGPRHVPGSCAGPVDPKLSFRLELLFQCPGSLGSFARSSAAKTPGVWPMPPPYPEVLSRDPWHLPDDLLKKLVINVLVMALNFLNLGKVERAPASGGS